MIKVLWIVVSILSESTQPLGQDEFLRLCREANGQLSIIDNSLYDGIYGMEARTFICSINRDFGLPIR